MTVGPEPVGEQRQTAHPGAADRDEVQAAADEVAGPTLLGCVVRGHAKLRISVAIRSAASGLAILRDASPMAASRSRSASSGATRSCEQVSGQIGVLDDDRGSRVRHPVRVRVLMGAGRMRVRHEHSTAAGGGELEDRAAGACQGEIAGSERVAEVGQVLEQRVAGARRRRSFGSPRSRGCR